MPHIVVEHSVNAPIDVRQLLTSVHRTVAESGIAPVSGLRTRAEPRADVIVADGDPRNAFVAVVLRLVEGRSREELDAVLAALLATVEEHLGDRRDRVAVSVECQTFAPEDRRNANHLRETLEAGA